MTDRNSAKSPITIGSLTIRNRLTMAPTVKFGFTDAGGYANEKYVEHYRARAHYGCGLICVEATAVTPDGRFTLDHMGLWEDGQIEGHKAITQACHEEGAAVIIQLNHAGYASGRDCGIPKGPSVIPFPAVVDGKRVMEDSVALTTEELHQIQDAFVEACVRAQKAGYDGVQLHGCHAYLINQFASPRGNTRRDEYGGSVENRARFCTEIIRRVREVCGPDFLIAVRIAGGDPSVEDAIAIGEEYVKAGCQYLQVSTGFEQNWDLSLGDDVPYNRCVQYGIRFHEHFSQRPEGKIPVSCVNAIYTPELVHYLLDRDLTDTVDLARASLADPRIYDAILNGGEYQKCFVCRNGCQYGPGSKGRCPAKVLRERKAKA